MVKNKIVIKLSMPSDKCRSKTAWQVCTRVTSVGITGDLKDQLEVVGEGVDAVSLVCCLRGKKKLGHVDILLVEEVKDKKKEEEEKEEEPPHCSCPGYPCYYHPGPMPYLVCEDQETTGCSIM